MTTDFHQQLAASSICDPESLKAFGQMYNAQNQYNGNFDKSYPHFPFFAQHFAPYSANPISSFSPSSSSTSSTSSNPNLPKKKAPTKVPEEQKDDAYKERRRRNNEAARKSRESRRKVDTENSVRVSFLEQENLYLKHMCQQLSIENATMKQRLAIQFPQFNTDSTVANVPSY